MKWERRCVNCRERKQKYKRCRVCHPKVVSAPRVSPIRTYESGGISLTLPQWAARLAVEYKTLQGRLRTGWSLDEVVAGARVKVAVERRCGICSRSEQEVAFRPSRQQCNECVAARKRVQRGENRCKRCGGAKEQHLAPHARYCVGCAAVRRAGNDRREYTRRHYKVAVADGFDGSLVAWAQTNCHLIKVCERLLMPRPVRLVRPTSPTHGMTEAEAWRWRYRNDPAFRMQEIVRSQVRKAIKPTMKGSRRTLAFLGYTAAALRDHIELQFTKGMDWQAVYDGRVHIDHVIPRVEFDHTNEEDVRRCWSLPNLRPLWKEENQAKGARRELLL